MVKTVIILLIPSLPDTLKIRLLYCNVHLLGWHWHTQKTFYRIFTLGAVLGRCGTVGHGKITSDLFTHFAFSENRLKLISCNKLCL